MEKSVQQAAQEMLEESYGLRGCRLQRLPGENLNYRVTCGRTEHYVLKIVGDDVPRAVVAMQNTAIGYAAARGFRVRLPQLIENKFGKIETGINLHINDWNRALLMHYLDGDILSEQSDISIILCENLGQTLAHFHHVMRDFDHPAARRNHRWNLATADQHEDKVGLFDDQGQRELLIWAFDGWHRARERMHAVPWQFIHGDAHDENWIVEGGRVTGLIDFGDCCHNPTVCDLAICLAYLMMRGTSPLPIAAAIGAGYQGVRPLTSAERGILFPLIVARLAVSICVSSERRTLDADHPAWFSSENQAWRLLRSLREMGEAAFVEQLK